MDEALPIDKRREIMFSAPFAILLHDPRIYNTNLIQIFATCAKQGPF